MNKNPLKWPLSIIGGLLILISELVFILISVFLWPTESSGQFSILTNFRSDLGNSSAGFNTGTGSIFFMTGIIIGGIAWILVFLGLNKLYRTEHKRIILLIGQTFGIFGGFALLITSLPLEQTLIENPAWGLISVLSIMIALVLLSIEIVKHPDYRKEIGYLGFVTVVFSIAFIFLNYLLNAMAFLFESISIWCIETWMVLIGLNILTDLKK